MKKWFSMFGLILSLVYVVVALGLLSMESTSNVNCGGVIGDLCGTGYIIVALPEYYIRQLFVQTEPLPQAALQGLKTLALISLPFNTLILYSLGLGIGRILNRDKK